MVDQRFEFELILEKLDQLVTVFWYMLSVVDQHQPPVVSPGQAGQPQAGVWSQRLLM